MSEPKKTLTQRVEDYIEADQKLKTVTKEIKELEAESDLTEQISDLQTQLKELRMKRIEELEDLEELKEKKEYHKNDKELIGVIIAQQLSEEQPCLDGTDVVGMHWKGYKFTVKEKLKVTKES